MVEGPGATRNKRKAQQAVGGIVKDVIVSCAKKNQSQSLHPPSDGYAVLKGRVLNDVFSVGKEVFLIFSKPTHTCYDIDLNVDKENIELSNVIDQNREVAIRLHFQMNGSLYCQKEDLYANTIKDATKNVHDFDRNSNSNKIPYWRKKTPSSLKIYFEKSSTLCKSKIVLETKESTTSLVSAFVARSKHDRLCIRDVCSSEQLFDPNAVAEDILTKRSSAMISDAILDQERFPGVGNIIKMEALHKAGVHPKRIVSSLSRLELMSVISNCRAYAMEWLASGRAPQKVVYNQTVCGSCHQTSVRIVKLGNDLSRVTFWCSTCQPLKVDNSPHQNSKGILWSPSSNNGSPSVCSMKKIPLVLPSEGKKCYCPQHTTTKLLLKRVRKKNSTNQGRLFRTCSIRSCPFFSWADTHFPTCRCETLTILRISKTERSGGRWFLSCRNKGKICMSSSTKSYAANDPICQTTGCDFFSWSSPCILKPLGRALTPLL